MWCTILVPNHPLLLNGNSMQFYLRTFYFTLFFAIYCFVSIELLAQVNFGKKVLYKGDSCWMLTVEKGQTWYGIAKLYTTSIAKIRTFNLNQDSILKIGQQLYIPINVFKSSGNDSLRINSQQDLTKLIQTTYTLNPNKPLRITVFLPFSFNETKQLKAREVLLQKKKIPKLTDNMTAYYRGLNAGFAKAKLPVNFSVYDAAENDTLLIHNWASKQGFESTDLIIGPVFSRPFKALLNARNGWNVPVVYPFVQSSIKSDSIVNVFFPLPGVKELIENLAYYCVDSLTHHTASIQIKVSSKSDKTETDLTKLFIHFVNQRVKAYNPLSIDTLIFESPKQSNIIAVFSSNEVYLNKLVTQLALNRNTNKLHLCSHLDLSRFQNLDMNDLNALNLTFPSAYNLLSNQKYNSEDAYRCENEYFKFGEGLATLISNQIQNKNNVINFNDLESKSNCADCILQNNYYTTGYSNMNIRNNGVMLFKYQSFKLRQIQWIYSQKPLKNY